MEDKWQSLGFKRKPFIDLSRTNPFLTTKQRQQLKLLEELVREGGHLLLLLGVAGVGKTTFLSALKKNIALPSTEATVGLCEMHGDQGVNIEMVKGLLAKHLAIEDTADTFMSTLRARLAHLWQSNQRFLLIIDDAHELPAETVRFILDVVSELDETEHSLSILLAGRLQLEHLCVSSANVNMDWNTGSSFTIILQPLNEEEMSNYIKHGLRQAGYRGVMPFSKTQFAELSQDSKGILARLVVMAVHILETKCRGTAASQTIISRLSKKVRSGLKRADQLGPSSKRDVKRHFNISKGQKGLITAAFSVAMLSVGWWVYLEGPASTAVDVSQGKVISVEKDEQWVKTVVKLDGNVRRADVTAPATPVIHTTSVPTVVATTTVAVTKVATPIANDTPVTPAIVTDKLITTPIANDAPATTTATAPIVKDVPIMTPIANDTPTPLVVKKKDLVSVTAQKKMAPTTSSSFRTQGYTIQIAGGTDLAALQKTVCQLWTQQAKLRCVGLPNNLRYIRTVKNGQDWYIAALGQYNSSSEAHTQLQQLPTTVQKNTPWVRAFAQIPSLIVVLK